MNRLALVLLRKAIIEYEISVIRNDTDDVILKKLTDISNACDDIKMRIDIILKKKEIKDVKMRVIK